MTLSHTYDGAAITHNIAPSTVSLTSAAEDGESSMSGLQIEDPSSTLTLLGHRPYVAEESACSQPRLFTGWTTERGIGRDAERGMFGNAIARIHDTTVVDLNALFAFRIISGTDGNRSAETWAARLNWLLASSYLSGLIADTGYIIVNTTGMDATDYRDGYPADVMRDLMERSGAAYTYFAFWDATAAAVGLWVGHLDEAISDSTLRISNVPADIDSTTTFAPDDAARLSITPTETFSEVTVEYAHGTKRLFRSRASTATKYIRRGAKISRPYTGSAATASTQAERFLDQHANEQDRITVTIVVPAAKAGLVTAGQRMDVKFSHLAGYTSFTSMRVVRLTVTPTDDTARYYSLALELLAPRVGTTGSGCGATLVQSRAFAGTNLGSFALTSAPVPGNLLVLALCSWAASAGNEPDLTTGWTRVQRIGGSGPGAYRWLEIWTRIAEAGDGATFGLSRLSGAGGVNVAYDVYEWSGAACGTVSVDDLAFDEITVWDFSGGGDTRTVTVTPTDARSTTVFAAGMSIDTDTGVVSLTWAAPLVEQSEQPATQDGQFGVATVALSPGAAQSVTVTGTGATTPGSVAQTLLIAVNLVSGSLDTEIDLPTPPAVTAIIGTINNLEYLGDIPLGLPEL